ncbi:DUF833-domain-containing protein [Ramicandelaber brevisporus]|nr:DUF833-domain-containing protein [Ramicandelaber brevisporus]
MCLVIWRLDKCNNTSAGGSTERYRLTVLSNRDEYLNRPVKEPHWWSTGIHADAVSQAHSQPGSEKEDDDVWAPLDMGHPTHGTWIGITKSGRFAFVTNVRGQHRPYDAPRQQSRGDLVKLFLLHQKNADTGKVMDVREYLEWAGRVYKDADGFNLVCGNVVTAEMGYITNKGPLADGVRMLELDQTYVLSNADIDSSWWRMRRGRELFDNVVCRSQQDGEECADEEKLFELLRDTVPCSTVIDYSSVDAIPVCLPPVDLPLGKYGTRTSTVIQYSPDGEMKYTAKSVFLDTEPGLTAVAKEKSICKFKVLDK